MQRRNALFELLYRKSTSFYLTCVPRPLQWAMEVFLLMMVRVSKNSTDQAQTSGCSKQYHTPGS